MADYAQARRVMVDRQVRTADVTDLRIISALLEVPREIFVPAARRAIAYLDLDVPVNESGRVLLKPMVFAKLLQAAGIGQTDRVLDVGCATGYSAGVLAKLGGEVVALEEDAALARGAGETLAQLGATNLSVVSGALSAGWAARAPYDVIVLEGAAEVVPDSLLSQLADGGRLVAVVGFGPMGKATLYRRSGGHATAQPVFDAAAPALPGFIKPAAFVF
ncbi:MAG TPA: protein-L-isoaspartate O-methyltransferase [Xanthobacteraceae bacterium]|nr:protein-L-isoaspartate O-methyltransferase [Xanthobacteraceae bacterium]